MKESAVREFEETKTPNEDLKDQLEDEGEASPPVPDQQTAITKFEEQ